ncbi:MAG: agmatinase, partial [Planctomycetaceae bacterium]
TTSRNRLRRIMTPFLDLPDSVPQEADALILPLPFEGSVSYGGGTAAGPAAALAATGQVETWDEELGFDLESLRYHTTEPVEPRASEPAGKYLERVSQAARELRRHRGLLIGLGGEHSLTPPLVHAAVDGPDDLSGVTVVQFDAHSDLRDTFHDTPHSHACAMRRLVERGARVVAIGIRSAEKAEFEYGVASGRVATFFAQRLAEDRDCEKELLSTLRSLTGPVYLTFDIDALEPALCPGTGTPQPGGLGWWPTCRYLRALLRENRRCELLGCDVVETAPQPGTAINEFTAAKLLAKIVAYRCAE